jgi:very-short-patch-repair endonuclease
MSPKHKIISYNPKLKSVARDLRRTMTLSEVLLWNQLKKKQILGFDFDRQRPLGNYVVDFYCKELSLVIEVDGSTHNFRYEDDTIRQVELEKLGIHFLRFDDLEVKRNLSNVIRVIEDWIVKSKPTPNPSGGGEFY